ncbi:hypothetical protein HK100_000660 [Physocladia obscura]|uniref:Uncharacterized protein n=1 Tax=Physocladia obscura TaxID=109957 RepID=A0AAD5SZ02_9FUNG|nr:hypothetical protein HK100_000660 [Physocladia obscura]
MQHQRDTFRIYINNRAPASHLTSFLILHELTAILPLPAIYYTLQATELQIPIPADIMELSEAKMDKVMQRYGWGPYANSDQINEQNTINSNHSKTRMLMDMATAYGIVKILMPVEDSELDGDIGNDVDVDNEELEDERSLCCMAEE